MLLRVINQAGESVPQHELSPVRLRLSQQGQKRIAHLGRDLFCSKQWQCLCQIQHFRNRGWFLQAPAAQGFGKARHTLMKFGARFWGPQLKNFGFALWGGVLDSNIETASAQGIADTPLFIGGQHNEGNAAGLDGSQLRHTELPDAEQFQQHSLESVVYLVKFVDEQDARPVVFEGQQKGPGTEESSALQYECQFVLVDCLGLGLKLNKQPL